jgi:hypothetical protein
MTSLDQKVDLIGIGVALRMLPCHTTRHAGPHRAVEMVEVMLKFAFQQHAWFRFIGFAKIVSLAATVAQASPASTVVTSFTFVNI